MCGFSEESLAFKVWRYHITQMIHAADFKQGDNNSDTLHSIQEKLAYFEDELLNLKEVTIIIELALWKVRMTMNENIHQEFMCSRQKKVRVDQSEFRWHCRLTCGANVVIGHVLPFLINYYVKVTTIRLISNRLKHLHLKDKKMRFYVI